MKPPEPGRPLRFVSAASLFDGHDAAINMIRRLLQSGGAEVVHLGHNRSVADIVRAAIAEDADAIAVSSYQGGHNEYFRYMIDMLRELSASHIRVVVGGGGTIAPAEIAELESYGVAKIYTPEDGRRLGLTGMIDDVFARVGRRAHIASVPELPTVRDHGAIAQAITLLEGGGDGSGADDLRRLLSGKVNAQRAPVVGLTGTGGGGKSSLTDELLHRFLRQFPDRQVAVVAIDPTRRRSGGALLGDRIRMNSLGAPHVFMRSLATRRQHLATSAVLADVIALYRAAGFDLIVVETAGIGQSDTEIVDLADLSLYVMTPEYGAASQLEKIDMLDFADMIVLNKFEKRGAEDALRDVRKQWRRNHPDRMKLPDSEVPVFPTVASRFNDPGVNRLFVALCAALDEEAGEPGRWSSTAVAARAEPVTTLSRDPLVPSARTRYLAEIATRGRESRKSTVAKADAARRLHGLYLSLQALGDSGLPEALVAAPSTPSGSAALDELRAAYNRALDDVGPEAVAALRAWPAREQGVSDAEYSYTVRGREVRGSNYTESLSHSAIPKLAAPRLAGWGEILEFLQNENLPGSFPYTAGVYPYRREEEDPTRMFAGEGAPERTNRRFHYLAAGHEATRLSTAFDSTTLYGEDPDLRPDIFGRTGNSGVSIATLDDMKKLYSGFDLCKPSTSVSMTINGPAPMILAMYMNTAIDQHVERFLRANGRWEAVEAALAKVPNRPKYNGALPPTHGGDGLGLLGVSGRQLVSMNLLASAEYEKLRAEALSRVRGTVQADILKEDQAQNTCIFSTEFARAL